ncbi:MAG: aspartyl/asparaginyl beta-hydroxylase-like dioxygenase [Nevskia sp.]|nr:aspartyl/asparaginyl beta-hydroxylase-like dioxygenase [Nevskia sp.]
MTKLASSFSAGTDSPGLHAVNSAEIEMARTLLLAGRMAEAIRMCNAMLERAPENGEILNLLGMAAIAGGDRKTGIESFHRAVRSDPENAVTYHNLGLAHRAEGNWTDALQAFRQALSLAPDSFVSRLNGAQALERLGRNEDALRGYFGAIRTAQAKGQWLNGASVSAGLRPLVEHAMAFVNRGRRRLFSELLAPLRRRYGSAAMQRVEACLAIYLGERRADYPDPRQRPNFLYFPSLPCGPYLPRTLFPWVDDFEMRTPAIVAELLSLIPQADTREAVFGTDDLERANLRGELGRPSWEGYYFYRHGVINERNCANCPETMQALKLSPLVQIRDHGPEVLFSLFSPDTHLLPHRGVTNARVVAHLPLIIPENCALRVGGEEHRWSAGHCVFFDDTYEHEAWNRSRELRAVLIFDLWNPYLTEIERHAVTDLIEAIGDFRAACDRDEAPSAAADVAMPAR